jgi:vacuolar-type H+-ATPase subunit F/Vma7
MTTRDRIHVIGSRDTVLGFSLLGISGSTPSDAEDLSRILREAFSDPQMALILIEEQVAADAPEIVSELQGRKDFPLVVEIPGPNGALEKESLKEYIAGAIGIQL